MPIPHYIEKECQSMFAQRFTASACPHLMSNLGNENVGVNPQPLQYSAELWHYGGGVGGGKLTSDDTMTYYGTHTYNLNQHAQSWHSGKVKVGVHPKMITLFTRNKLHIHSVWALSRMVKVRGACDKPFWIL